MCTTVLHSLHVRLSFWDVAASSSPRKRREMTKVKVLCTTRTLDDNVSVVSIDINSVHCSLNNGPRKN